MTLQSKTFSELITFSRASGGWYFNSSGMLVQAAANEPRIDYDPVTLACRGLLIEEQRTNLCRGSESFSTTHGWGGNLSATQHASAQFHGVPYVELKKQLSLDSENRSVSLGSVASGTSLVARAALRAGTASVVSVGLYQVGSAWGAWGDSTARVVRGPGAVYQVSGGLWAFSGLSAAEDTVVEVTRIYSATETGSLYIYPGGSNSTTIGASILATCAQVEAGSFATSYIKAEASQVTRAADFCTVDTLSPWFNALEGTFVIEGGGAGAAGGETSTRYAALSNGTNDERLIMYGGSLISYSGNTAVGSTPTAGSFLASAKRAWAYKPNDAAFCNAGGPVTTADSFSLPVGLSTLAIGRNSPGGGSTFVNGHIKSLSYYPKRLSNSELQALTA